MKQVIILFGQPGAGKGTQADLLAAKLNLYYFETSRILEAKFREAQDLPKDSPDRLIDIGGKRCDILEEKKLWEEGKLCSPLFVADLVEEKIKELSVMGKNLVLSGSPRTLQEAEKIMPLIEQLYGIDNIKIFFIKITAQETIFRNSHRKICELMRHSILFNKETENLTICPLDGSKLIRREGLDDPEVIKVRLKEYAERTEPIFDYFEKRGLKIKKVNGEQSVADVYGDVLAAVK